VFPAGRGASPAGRGASPRERGTNPSRSRAPFKTSPSDKKIMSFFLDLASFAFSWFWPVLLAYISYRVFSWNDKKNIRYVKVYEKRAEKDKNREKKKKKKTHKCKNEINLFTEEPNSDSDSTDDDLDKPVLTPTILSRRHPLSNKLRSIGKPVD
jgi:hypothetical protein